MRPSLPSLARERLEVFEVRPYRFYFAAIWLSNIGVGMRFIGDSWLILTLTGGSASSVPLLLLVSSLPGVLLFPLIGLLVDRRDRRLLCVGMDCLRALVLAALLALLVTDRLRAWELFAAALLIAAGDQVYLPAATALIRELVPGRLLLAANATTGVALQTGTVLGAAAGGVVIALTSVTGVYAFNTLTFCCSAACVWLMRPGLRVAAGRERGPGGWRSFAGGALEGYRHLRRQPDVAVYGLMMLLLVAALRTYNSLLAPFARLTLHVGARGFGFIDAGFAAGAIAGGLVLPLLARRLDAPRLAFAGVVALGLLTCLFAVSGGLPVPVLLYCLIGLAFQAHTVYRTSVQRAVDVSLLGRVFALLGFAVSLASLVAYALMGALSAVLGPRAIYAGLGVALVAAGVASRLALRRPGAGEERRRAAGAGE